MTPMERYLMFGLRQVAGWLNPTTAEFTSMIGDLQRRAGYAGAVGEIGVHHGKFFMVLRLAAGPGDRAFVVDIFEDQALNVDGSGLGDRSILRQNLERWCGTAEGVAIIAKSSLDVTPDEILSACGPVRLASIDGGHTAECAYSDLKLIDAVMPDHGVAILDDYFNEDWPDVSTGTARYIAEPGSRLRPFAITPNKVFLTTEAFNPIYRAKIAKETPFRRYKTSQMFGLDVDVFHAPPTVPPIADCIRETLRQSAVGPYLLWAKAALAGGAKRA